MSVHRNEGPRRMLNPASDVSGGLYKQYPPLCTLPFVFCQLVREVRIIGLLTNLLDLISGTRLSSGQMAFCFREASPRTRTYSSGCAPLHKPGRMQWQLSLTPRDGSEWPVGVVTEERGEEM